MSNISFRAINISIPDSVLYKALEAAEKQVLKRIQRTLNIVKPHIQKMLTKAIENSRVYKGLIGDLKSFGDGYDLQAEFGLTDDMAKVAVDKMVEILTAENYIHVDIRPQKTAKTWKIEIIINVLDPEDYEDRLKNRKEFSYTNTGGSKQYRNFRVEWMRWILEGVSNILGNFGITYIGEASDVSLKSHEAGGKLGQIEVNFSRSKRALMTKNEQISSRFPYTIPKLVIPAGKADNFIDEIRNNILDDIKEYVQKIVKREIQKE